MAGATTIEVNGVPVSTTAPLPILAITGGGTQPADITKVSGVANPVAVTPQAYTVARVPVDSVVRGDDGATYTAISVRGNAAGKNSLFPRAANALNVNARQQVADLCVSATGAAAAAVTLTLPAPGASLRQYITRIQIIQYAAGALTGGATPVTVTTTNIPGTPTFTFPTAQAIGVNYEQNVEPSKDIEAILDNTAVTIVCPATTSVIWRVNVWYYNG